MIVNRRKFVAKQGAMEDLVALMKAEAKRINLTITFRLYTPSIAPFGLVAAEYEFGSLEDYEKFWTDWFARPETAEFMEKWAKLTESGGTNEIWNLEA
jgi:hypothetical protein